MGRGAHPQLEQRRLDGAAAARGRQDRAPGRRARGRAGGDRLDERQPVQGAVGRARHRRGRRAGAQGDRLRAAQLPDRSVHRPGAGARARLRAGAGRARRDRGTPGRTHRAADAHACQLPQRPQRAVRVHAGLQAGRRHRAPPVRHAAGAVAGRARVRRRHRAHRRAAGRHGGAARQVARAHAPVRGRGRGALPRAHTRIAARRRAARQPGLLQPLRDRLRRGAGLDRARRDRRLPRPPTSCASASRRCTCAMSTPGTPRTICARCWPAANGAAPSSTGARP